MLTQGVRRFPSPRGEGERNLFPPGTQIRRPGRHCPDSKKPLILRFLRLLGVKNRPVNSVNSVHSVKNPLTAAPRLFIIVNSEWPGLATGVTPAGLYDLPDVL